MNRQGLATTRLSDRTAHCTVIRLHILPPVDRRSFQAVTILFYGFSTQRCRLQLRALLRAAAPRKAEQHASARQQEATWR